jgi:hypothetical protein
MISRLAAALLASGLCLSALASVTASLDKTRVALGDTVRLLIQSDGSTGAQPDIGPLQQDFEVLGSSRGSSTQIINGHMSSQSQVTLMLSPKHAGTLAIPPLRWGNEQSAALTLTVEAGNAANTGTDGPAEGAPISISATLDQKQPYVQSAVVLTIRLYVGTQVSQASLELPASSEVLARQLGEDRQSSETRNGRTYQVIERTYVLTPQRSGKLSLKGPQFEAQVPSGSMNDLNSFFGNAFGRLPFGAMLGGLRPVRLSASAIEMNVLPRPAAATGADWLPAKQVTLQEHWRPEAGTTLHVGEPITRHLQLSALGLSGAQLPDLAKLMPLPDGIKAYPDQAKNDDKLQNGALLGSREQDIALIASQPGHYELPALRLAWWDTTSNTPREATLPARSLDIQPAVGGASAAPAQAQPAANPVPGLAEPTNTPASTPRPNLPGIGLASTSVGSASFWPWLSAALALLWLGTLLAWGWSLRTRAGGPSAAAASPSAVLAPGPAGHPSATQALRALQTACRNNNAQAARQHVLAWAAACWPQAAPRGLHALIRQLADARFTAPLQQLDRACSTAEPWSGETLAQAFASAPQPKPADTSAPLIPDLYG